MDLLIRIFRLQNILLFFYVMLIIIALDATANAKSDNIQFQKYLTTDKGYSAHLKDKVSRAFKKTFPGCQAAPTQKRKKPLLLTSIKMPTETDLEIRKKALESENEKSKNRPKDTKNLPAHPKYGQWIERFQTNACGHQVDINILANAYNINDLPATFPLLNGETKVSIIEQPRAISSVKTAANKSIKNCFSSPLIINTHFLGYRNPKDGILSDTDKNNGSFERWIIKACDKDHAVDIAILPDAQNQFKYIARIRGNKQEKK